MSAESDNRADFFRELAILLKSDLPLPGSIRNLARSARGSRFRKTLNQVGDATASGQTLAEAMKEFPRDFSVYQIRFVEVGESTGSLPDVLHEIGRLARADHHMIERTRALATYPVAVMLIGSAIFLCILRYVVPQFDAIFTDMLGDTPLPPLTQLTIGMSRTVNVLWLPTIFLCALAIFGLIWLVSGSVRANRCVFILLGLIPGSGRLALLHDYACTCALWSVYIRRKMPMPEALEMIADTLHIPALRKVLLALAEKQKQGMSLVDAVKSHPGLDSLLYVTVLHTPAEELATVLEDLGKLYDERAQTAREAMIQLWDIWLVVLMAVFIGFIVFSMFLPMTKLIEMM